MYTYSTSNEYQLAYKITELVNAWLDIRMAAHDYDPNMQEAEIDQFLNLPLNAVFGLVDSGYMPPLPPEHPSFVSADTVIRYLREGTAVNLTDVCRLTDGISKNIVEIITAKTNLQRWIQQKVQEGAIGTKLKNILVTNMHHWRYLEDIDKFSFFRCRQGGIKGWDEFVRLRGW